MKVEQEKKQAKESGKDKDIAQLEKEQVEPIVEVDESR